MKKLELGMKIYSYDWYWKYGMSYAEAARLLKEQGVSFVISQNEYIPAMDTAAKSEVPPEAMARFRDYDDIPFRQALKEEGIAYWVSAHMFFHPKKMVEFDATPVGIDGKTCQKEDWYIGVCPSSDAYVRHKVDQICRAVEILKPDGIFLAFMRFPGFWEVWLPGTDPAGWNDCCYCDNCIEKFQNWSGITVEETDPAKRGRWIREHCYAKYALWKAHRLREIILTIRERTGNKLKIMLNTVAFDEANFGNARAEVFGQDIAVLSDVVDVFEIMAYHQILGQPGAWVAKAAEDAKKRVMGDSQVFCTVQGKPDYLTGMHSGKGRQETISLDEYASIIADVRKSGFADGVVVYSWADFLEHKFEQNSTEYIDRINKALI